MTQRGTPYRVAAWIIGSLVIVFLAGTLIPTDYRWRVEVILGLAAVIVVWGAWAYAEERHRRRIVSLLADAVAVLLLLGIGTAVVLYLIRIIPQPGFIDAWNNSVNAWRNSHSMTDRTVYAGIVLSAACAIGWSNPLARNYHSKPYNRVGSLGCFIVGGWGLSTGMDLLFGSARWEGSLLAWTGVSAVLALTMATIAWVSVILTPNRASLGPAR